MVVVPLRFLNRSDARWSFADHLPWRSGEKCRDTQILEQGSSIIILLVLLFGNEEMRGNP